MKLNELKNTPGARKKAKVVGRGPGSGHGKTSCRGHKGQLARAGSGKKLGYEGGQMPLYRRIPKKGFTNIFRRDYAIINVDSLNKFSKENEVVPELLYKSGMADKGIPIKILGNGEFKGKNKIVAHKFRQSAREKITKAGGSVEEVPFRKKSIKSSSGSPKQNKELTNKSGEKGKEE